MANPTPPPTREELPERPSDAIPEPFRTEALEGYLRLNAAFSSERQFDSLDLIARRTLRLVPDIPGERALAIHERCKQLATLVPRVQPAFFAGTVRHLCRTLFVGPALDQDLSALLLLLNRIPEPTNLDTPVDTWLSWLRGLIQGRFGAVRRAIHQRETARRGLIELKAPIESVMVAVDLGMFYADEQRWSDLHSLVADLTLAQRGLFPAPLHSALLLWRDGVLHHDVSDSVVRHLRTVLAGVPAEDVGIPPSSPVEETERRGSYWKIPLSTPRAQSTGRPQTP